MLVKAVLKSLLNCTLAGGKMPSGAFDEGKEDPKQPFSPSFDAPWRKDLYVLLLVSQTKLQSLRDV